MRTFLLPVHVVLGAGLLLGAARTEGTTGIVTAGLLTLAAICAGLWLDRRWTAVPAALLALAAAATAGYVLTRGLAAQPSDRLRFGLALLAVVIVELATIAHALRARPGSAIPEPRKP